MREGTERWNIYLSFEKCIQIFQGWNEPGIAHIKVSATHFQSRAGAVAPHQSTVNEVTGRLSDMSVRVWS